MHGLDLIALGCGSFVDLQKASKDLFVGFLRKESEGVCGNLREAKHDLARSFTASSSCTDHMSFAYSLAGCWSTGLCERPECGICAMTIQWPTQTNISR